MASILLVGCEGRFPVTETQKVLITRGHVVTALIKPEDALELMKSTDFDLLVTDYGWLVDEAKQVPLTRRLSVTCDMSDIPPESAAKALCDSVEILLRQPKN